MTTKAVRTVAVAAVTAAMGATGVMAAGAAAPTTIKSKVVKVKPSGRTAKLTLTKQGTKVTLSLFVKRNGKYKLVKRRVTSRPLLPGSTEIRLTADQSGAAYERNGGQGLVSWNGPDAASDADDYAEYFGWNIEKRRLELFGLSR